MKRRRVFENTWNKQLRFLAIIKGKPQLSINWPLIDLVYIDGVEFSLVNQGMVRRRHVWVRNCLNRWHKEWVYTVTPFGKMVLIIERV